MRQLLALPGNVAALIIPHRPAFFDSSCWLYGIIRIDHWIATQQMSPLNTWVYLNDNLPQYFKGTTLANDYGQEMWGYLDERHNELVESIACAITHSYPILEPILSRIPDVIDFSYVDRGVAGVYLEVHYDDSF